MLMVARGFDVDSMYLNYFIICYINVSSGSLSLCLIRDIERTEFLVNICTF